MIGLILFIAVMLIIIRIESNRYSNYEPSRRSKSEYGEWYRNTYLRSSHWHKTRIGALSRAGYKCEECGNNRNLQIHHLTYVHLGEELPHELQCLCRECHKETHHIQ